MKHIAVIARDMKEWCNFICVTKPDLVIGDIKWLRKWKFLDKENKIVYRYVLNNIDDIEAIFGFEFDDYITLCDNVDTDVLHYIRSHMREERV